MNELQHQLESLVDTEWALCRNRKLPGLIRAYRWRTGELMEGGDSETFDRIEDAIAWLGTLVPEGADG
jgi:hypothetical protein